MSKIEFKVIQKENIFCESFNNFSQNNELQFDKKIVVLYGPNGTGKTSLAKILNKESKSKYSVQIGQSLFSEKDDAIFHVINDQNGRNIINGVEEEFLLGDNISKEYELQRYINNEFGVILGTNLSSKLKKEFNISKKDSTLISLIKSEKIKSYVTQIVNIQSKGKDINKEEFINTVGVMTLYNVEGYEESKYEFLKTDYDNGKSIIKRIESILKDDLKACPEVVKIEENDEAINILTKFPNKCECVVCDNEIETAALLDMKKKSKERILKSLDKKAKALLEDIVDKITMLDPFELKKVIREALRTGEIFPIEIVVEEINKYKSIFNMKIEDIFHECLNGSEIESKYAEYKSLIESKPTFTDEDILFIEHVVNENIEKPIKLERDTNKNLKLTLNGEEFLNQNRDKLKLSNGEQNFISLAFELLKAKNSKFEYIVIDDPISSFDSIYKNKIAFTIMKFLENKNQIIMTHNTELIRLLEHQKQDSFNLYLFNNTSGEENGFIKVSDEEQKILLYLDRLLNLFRGEIINELKNEKMYLISMIPFARGYAQITNSKLKNNFTSLMHGYSVKKEKINELYNELFGNGVKMFTTEYEISAKDITEIDIKSLDILKSDTKYPLLDKTLKHTLVYLFLRLSVEKTLVDKYKVNTKKFEMLSQIIFKAFIEDNEINKKRRIFLASRKTLLNEFNHFEGNMNIFQPAIDITDSALKKEREGIVDFLSKL